MNLLDDIHRVAAEAEALCEQWRPDVDDDDAWDALDEAVKELDRRAGSGLAIGKYLTFQVADGEALYIIDEIKDQVIHCIWIANLDEREAEAVDGDGWCLRSVAEAKIRRREERERSAR
jgi:hypothetical protein